MKLSALFLAVAALPTVAFAAPMVTFQAEITSQTCEVSIDGATNAVVVLPTVSTVDLAGAGATAGLTPFTISLSGCTAPAMNTPITTLFIGHNITAGYNLGNSATASPATNVAIQLTVDAAGRWPIELYDAITPATGLILRKGDTTASYQFGARYISEAGGATAGAVTAVAEYTISYL